MQNISVNGKLFVDRCNLHLFAFMKLNIGKFEKMNLIGGLIWQKPTIELLILRIENDGPTICYTCLRSDKQVGPWNKYNEKIYECRYFLHPDKNHIYTKLS